MSGEAAALVRACVDGVGDAAVELAELLKLLASVACKALAKAKQAGGGVSTMLRRVSSPPDGSARTWIEIAAW